MEALQQFVISYFSFIIMLAWLMAKERRQKNVQFGLSKDDSMAVAEFPQEGRGFHSARDYWQHMCGNTERAPCHESLFSNTFIKPQWRK